MNAALGLLEVSGLIRREGEDPRVEFAFRHTLLRDTAYNSLLLEERKQLHRQVGQALERAQPENNAELASVLAHHFLQADLKERAFGYLCQAADEAARVYALTEALDHYGRALELALDGHGEEGDLEYLFERKGRMLELAGRYQAAVETYLEMEQAGRSQSQPGLEVRGLIRRASLYCIPTAIMDSDQGKALSERALAMARELGDRPMESLAHWNLMKVDEFQLDYKPARVHGERALELLEGLEVSEQRAFILNDLAGIYMSTADLERGMEVSRQAKDLWLKLDNLPMLVDAHGNEIILQFFRGNYALSKQISQQAIDLSETIDNVWGKSYSRYMAYWAFAEEGDMARALETARLCVSYAEEAGFVVPQFQTLADIALIHASLGEFDQAHSLLDRAGRYARKFVERWATYVDAVQALILSWQGRADEAEVHYERLKASEVPASKSEFSFLGFILSLAGPGYWLGRGEWRRAVEEAEHFIDLFEHLQIEFLQPDLYLCLGLAHRGLGDLEEASEALAQGLARAERLGSRRTLWQLYDAAAAVASELGDEALAQERKGQAEEFVAFIADHTESEEQRQSFLRWVAASSLSLGAE